MVKGSETIVLSIQGMSCSACQERVEKALRAVQGVAEVSVDLAGGRATVRGTAQVASLVAAAEEAGYPAQVVD